MPGSNVEEAVKRLRIAARKSIAVWEDEYEQYDLTAMETEFVRGRVEDAMKHKEQLQDIIPELQEVQGQEQLVATARDAKIGIIQFIKTAQQLLQRTPNTSSSQPAAPPVGEPPPAAINDVRKKFKIKKVQDQEARLIADLDALAGEFKSLSITQPLTERDVKVLEEQFNSLAKRSDQVIKDGNSLTNDALDGGLEAAANCIDSQVSATKEARLECETRLGEKKTGLGVIGESSARMSELKPPTFSGDHTTGLDFFSFKKEYDEYANSKTFSHSQQLRVLKRTCLIGAAQALCTDMTSVGEILNYLKKHYGCARTLLNSRISDFRALGSCPHNSASRRRTWLITANQKLKDLQRLAEDNGLEYNLYFSSLLSEIRLALPIKLEELFKERLEDTASSLLRPAEVFTEMIKFFDYLVARSSFDVNYELSFQPRQVVEQTKGSKTIPPPHRKGFPVWEGEEGGLQDSSDESVTELQPSRPTAPRPPAAVALPAVYSAPVETKCHICKKLHFYLFQCKKFQDTRVKERNRLTRTTRACYRCLRMDSALDLADREGWWEKHKHNCEDTWACSENECPTNPPEKQYHFTMCFRHVAANKAKAADFVKSVGNTLVKPGAKFFFFEPMFMSVVRIDPPPLPQHLVSSVVHDDINEPSIFMLQMILTPAGEPLMTFYDSGCNGSALSDHAVKSMVTQQVTAGPTKMGVAGGKVVEIPGGDVRFWLDLADEGEKATFTGLNMPHITTPFPCWPLMEAFNALQAEHRRERPDDPPLPPVPAAIGGREVDVMIGIRYIKYFPKPIFSLPCGLTVFQGQFKAENGVQGVLGGTHKSWRQAENMAQFMTPKIFFSHEMQAYRVECNTLKHIYHELHHQDEDAEVHDLSTLLVEVGAEEEPGVFGEKKKEENAKKEEFSNPSHGGVATSGGRQRSTPCAAATSEGLETEDEDKRREEKNAGDTLDFLSSGEGNVGLISNFLSPKEKNVEETSNFLSSGVIGEPKCTSAHCAKHSNSDFTFPIDWDLSAKVFSAKQDLEKFECFDGLGSELTYRCIRCRNCAECRKGDALEQGSFEGEAQQALMEKCVEFNHEKKRLETSLPFILDPVTHLAPNRYIALKVIKSQLEKVKKNPGTKDDILAAHNKLLDKGHVCAVDDLPPDLKVMVMEKDATVNYIPWSVVTKLVSMSTPHRMVYNASSKTSSGFSLNSILAKGENRLPKIFDILIKFGSKKSGFISDVSMAYNSVALKPHFFNFQRYLWQPELDPNGKIVEMVIKTLIYGVICSGGLTAIAFCLVALFARDHHPEHSEGAEALEQAYVDDVAVPTDTLEDAKRVAKSMDFVLEMASMSVKAHTFAGEQPSERVSADGESVGLLGYTWRPVADTVSLAVKELFFGKVVRGKLPDSVVGDTKKSLEKCFTRRTIVAKFASVFDPLGYATPITSRIKLDLAAVTGLKLGWDDPLPPDLLDLWSSNLEDMQNLRRLRFKRSYLHPDAVDNQVELLCLTDASATIAVASVYARSKLPDGSFSCQLVAAKSKLVHLSTVPRGELRGAVLGATLAHMVRRNLGSQHVKTIFATDSTIVLFWLHQDARPLQTAVRNAVIEIRRLSNIQDWFHIDSKNNLADLGTRNALVSDLESGSKWQVGEWWMSLPQDKMPLMSLEDVQMSQKEKQEANKEIKAADICGICLPALKSKVGDFYSFSQYIVDPCALPWDKSVRALAYVFRFVDCLKARVRAKRSGPPRDSEGSGDRLGKLPGKPNPPVESVSQPPPRGSTTPPPSPPSTRTRGKAKGCTTAAKQWAPYGFVATPPPEIDESTGITPPPAPPRLCSVCIPAEAPPPGDQDLRTPTPSPVVELHMDKGKPSALRHDAAEYIPRKKLQFPVLSQEIKDLLKDAQLSKKEILRAEKYFFKKGSREIKQFAKLSDYKNCSIVKDGILHYSGRILEGQQIIDVENIMGDLDPLTFCRPLLCRYSPIAYAIMVHAHQKITHHRNAICSLRESRYIAFILKGRDLAIEVRENCSYCQRFKARLVQAEMGKIHSSRLTISPAFYFCQTDLLGPYRATCEHNCRSSVAVWGAVFKDPASGAIAVYGMPGYSTGHFIQAYTRHAARYGHPLKLFIDGGGQLMKACKELEFSWTDLTNTLNSRFGVGVQHVVVNVAEHSAHGVVERSIREIKRLYNVLYKGLKLDLFGYETAFSFVANELNSLPLCLGSKYENLDHTDLITPSRLMLGRNNKRAPAGYPRISSKSRQVEQLDKVQRAWWQAWKEERMEDYIPAPRKWHTNTRPPAIGDIVVFIKDENVLGDSLWRLGRICKLIPSAADGIVRSVVIEYRNATEKTFRETKRSIRKVAILYREGDLGLIETLNEAAREADRALEVEFNHDSVHMEMFTKSKEMPTGDL